MKNTASFLSLFIVISLTGSLYAQKMTSSKIDALLERVLESTPSVGIAVAVVKDGKQIHSKGYGFKSINGKEKVDQHTLFAIASNSKAFTAAALAILVDEGKLKWMTK